MRLKKLCRLPAKRHQFSRTDNHRPPDAIPSAQRPAARQASSISFSGTAIRFGPLWASARSLEIISPNVTVKGSETITVGLQLGDGSVVCYCALKRTLQTNRLKVGIGTVPNYCRWRVLISLPMMTRGRLRTAGGNRGGDGTAYFQRWKFNESVTNRRST